MLILCSDFNEYPWPSEFAALDMAQLMRALQGVAIDITAS